MKKTEPCTQTVNKKKSLPDSYVLLFAMLIIASVVTWFVPAGSFERTSDSGVAMVIPDSYSSVPTNPTTLYDFFLSIQSGLIDSAGIIFLVLTIGGAFAVLEHTGAIQAGIMQLIKRTRSRKYALIVAVSTVFSIAGFIGALQTAVIAFIPIGIIIARAFKLDAVAGVAIIYLGAYAGYTIGGLDPITTGFGQEIAGLPIFSGLWFRSIVYIAILISTILYLCRYISKVSMDQSRSVLGATPFPAEVDGNASIPDVFTRQHKIILGYFTLCMIGYVVGVFNLGWGLNEMAGLFLVISLGTALIQRISSNHYVQLFIRGAQGMLYAALIVGLARAIVVVLEDAYVLDTIVNSIAVLLEPLPRIFSALGMYIFNLGFNTIISSASGQAAIVVPVMAPLADAIGLTRQVAVLAYNFGDGFTNIITPTSGILMASIAIGGVPWIKWLKFVFPLLCIWVAIGAVALSIAVMIDLGPF
ncbi:AbgT family transporter [Chromohalobacter sp. 296-RDG]|uniref:YfcC family protein n=1 Tax=Chromohalobacter sp. 296-RDG TaxID=2994062 RepID=UPI0024686A82|nr:AbgT family transporter [Chromohalobacter sp. 296-RDG]